MASYNELNALIDAYINRNGVQAITGQILNGVLKAMVEQLGRGYTIMGAAIPATDPGTPDAPECYFASETGTYTGFDGLQVVPGELALLCYTPSDGWTKATIYEGFRQVGATIDGNVGTPSVGVSYANGVLSFDFHNMKGNPGQNGQDGAAAGFGTIGADITGGVGTPGVSVESSGPATAKNLQFHFTNLKGETGVTSVVATVDNTTGNPACTVSLVGQQLTLAFSGLKGAQGNTGSSVAYPFELVNNLTTNDATKALSAAQGVVLDGKIALINIDANGKHITRTFSGNTSWNEGIPLPDGFTYKIKLAATGDTPGSIYLYRYTDGARGTNIESNLPFPAELTYTVPSGDDGISILVVSASGDRTYTMDAVAVDSTKKTIDGLLADVADLDERTDELEETTAGFSEDKYYSRATLGVYFGDNEVGQLLASAMKAAWIEIYDQQNMPPEVVNLTFLQNNSSGCNVAFGVTGQAVLFAYSNGTKQSGIQTIALGYSSLGVYYARIYMKIDFDILDNVRYIDGYAPLGPSINTRETNGWEKITITMRDKCTDLQSHLFGKKVVVFGDSLSEFTGTDGLQWTTHLERFAGCTAINVGIGGAEFGQRATPSLTPANADQAYAGLDIVSMVYAACGVDFDGTNDYMDVVEASEAWVEAHTRDNNAAIIARFKAIDWSKVDAVILFAGTNDWNNSPARFGESGSYNPQTTLGGINEIIRCLLSTYKKLRVYFVSPTVRWMDYDTDPTDHTKFCDYVVHEGRTLQQWVADVKAEVNKRHIEYCDLYNTLGWTEWNFSEFFTSYDGTHPSKGYAEIARKIATFISNT